jgi:hypothetical protein
MDPPEDCCCDDGGCIGGCIGGSPGRSIGGSPGGGSGGKGGCSCISCVSASACTYTLLVPTNNAVAISSIINTEYFTL